MNKMFIIIRKGIILLSLLLLGGAAFSGCASEGSAAGADKAEVTDLSAMDHISMKALPETTAEMVQEDANIIKERLDSYAGEERYVLEVSDPEDSGTAPRIEIYLDPQLKGKEDLSTTAGIYISAPLQFNLYSNESGYLDLEEDQFLDLYPADIARLEMTGSEDAGITLQFTAAYLAKNRQILEQWKDSLIMINDIREKTTKLWLSGARISTWKLEPADDLSTWTIKPEQLQDGKAAFLEDNLQKEPLYGSYASVCQPAIKWDGKELTAMLEGFHDQEADPETASVSSSERSNIENPGSLRCSREELKAAGGDTVTVTLFQSDRNMDDESRARILTGLCSRLDALGNPYCIGEMSGLKGTFAVETLPDHINENVIDILQSTDPFYLTANVYMLNLEGGQVEAKVTALKDGSLALDLSLTRGGKDSLHRMSLAQEELGGGEICLCLHRDTPICGARTENSISDGHLVFDRNYTGIGGDTWNNENRWILDLICAAVNSGSYPPAQKLGLLDDSATVDLLICREYFQSDRDGISELPEDEDFSDDTIVSEMLTELRAVAPDAEITDRSDYAEYVIRLNLKPEEANGERKDLYLAAVYQALLAGPMINADVYLGSADTDYTSFRTYYSEEEIRISEGFDVSEEFYKQVMSKIYADNPAMSLLERRMEATLQSIKENLRK